MFFDYNNDGHDDLFVGGYESSSISKDCRANLHLIHKIATTVFDLENVFFSIYYLLTVAPCAPNLFKGQSLSVNGVFHAITGIIIHPRCSKMRDEFDMA